MCRLAEKSAERVSAYVCAFVSKSPSQRSSRGTHVDVFPQSKTPRLTSDARASGSASCTCYRTP